MGTIYLKMDYRSFQPYKKDESVAEVAASFCTPNIISHCVTKGKSKTPPLDQKLPELEFWEL